MQADRSLTSASYEIEFAGEQERDPLSSIFSQIEIMIAGISSLRGTDVLGLREKAQCLLAAFAANAALFHSAEGDTEVSEQPAIDPDRAGVDLFGDTMRAAQVLCPDA